ncbi:MAG: DUF5011 domain-containing protein [Patescibacteria group bacterium]|nr:DUF5011 domain-containing protein [Patescibacteria group bacterium]
MNHKGGHKLKSIFVLGISISGVFLILHSVAAASFSGDISQTILPVSSLQNAVKAAQQFMTGTTDTSFAAPARQAPVRSTDSIRAQGSDAVRAMAFALNVFTNATQDVNDIVTGTVARTEDGALSQTAAFGNRVSSSLPSSADVRDSLRLGLNLLTNAAQDAGDAVTSAVANTKDRAITRTAQLSAQVSNSTTQFSSQLLDSAQSLQNRIFNAANNLGVNAVTQAVQINNQVSQSGAQAAAATQQAGAQTVAAVQQIGSQTIAATQQAGAQTISAAQQAGLQTLNATQQLGSQTLSAAEALRESILTSLTSLLNNAQAPQLTPSAIPSVQSTAPEIVSGAVQAGQQIQNIFNQNFLGPRQAIPVSVPPTAPLLTDAQKQAIQSLITNLGQFNLSSLFSPSEIASINQKINANQLDDATIQMIADRVAAKLPQVQQVITRVQTNTVTNTQTKETQVVMDAQKLADLQALIQQVQKTEQADRQNLFNALALTNRINSISNVTIVNPTVSGTLTTSGTTDFSNINSLGAKSATITNGLTAGTFSAGTTTFSGQLTANAAIQASSTLQVTGTTHLFGDLTVDGMTSIGSISLSNPTFTGNTTVQDNLYVNGGTFALGTGSATSTLTSAGGNLGIGTTSPSQTLAVQGNGFFSGDITNVANITATGTLNLTGTTGTTTIAAGQGFNAGNGALVVVGSTGYFGIGTTSPSKLFSVQGSGLFSGDLALANLTATGTLNVTGLTTLVNASTTQITSTGNAYLATTGGNVGIGSTTPGATLAVTGTSLFDGLATMYQALLGSFTATSSVTVQGKSTLTNATTTQLTASAYFQAGGDNGLTVLSSGLTGVGTTTPSQQFAVQGNGLFSGDLTAANVTATGTLTTSGNFNFTNASGTQLTTTHSTYLATTGGNVGVGTTTPGGLLAIGNNVSSGGVYVNANGNLGIGTNNPTVAEEINGALSVVGFLSASTLQNANNNLDLRGAGTGGVRMNYNQGSGGLSVFDGSTDQLFTVLSGGNVGVGTTTPSQQFAVQGNGLFSGNLTAANVTATGTLNVSGQTTLANASTTQIGSTGNAYLATSAGNVGIGTTNPGALLQLSQSASNVDLYLTNTLGAGQTWSLNSDHTGHFNIHDTNSNFFTIIPSGNVGIGTTSPSQKFAVQGSALVSGDLTAANVTATGTLTTSGNFNFTNASGTQLTTTNSTYLATAGGNVGVGTTSPGSALYVEGSNGPQVTARNFTSSGFAGFTAQNDTGNAGYFLVRGSTSVTRPNTVELYSNTGSDIALVPAGSEAVRIAAGGNVGIGSTTPGANLSVSGTSLFDGLATLYNALFGNITATGTVSVSGLASFNGNASTTQLTSTGSAYLATSAGNVGIGTASPTQKLEVVGADDNATGTLYVRSSNAMAQDAGGSLALGGNYTSGGAAASWGLIKGGKENGIDGNANGYLSFLTRISGQAPDEKVRITSAGNVGIGTTSPSQTLAVQGNALFSGNLTAANVTATGTLTTTGLFTFTNASGTQLTTTGSTYLATTGGSVSVGSTAASDVDSGGLETNLTGNANRVGLVVKGDSTTDTILGIYNTSSGGKNWQLRSAGQTGSATYIPAGGLGFFDGTNLPLFFNGADSLLAANGGNVGIGSTTPTALLAVNAPAGQASFTIGSSTATSLIVDKNGNVGIGTASPGVKVQVQGGQSNEPALGTATGGLSVLSDNGLYGMYFGVNPTNGNSWLQAMRNDSATAYSLNLQPVGGNVGIGTTSPSQKFAVQGGALVSGDLTAANITATGTLTTTGLFTFTNASGTQLTTTGSTYLATAGGNVGIGTSTPTEQFLLEKTGDTYARLTAENLNAGTSVYAGLRAVTDGGSSYFYRTSNAHATYPNATVIQDSGTGDIVFAPGSEAMRIKNGGNVGIGTTSPSQNLAVQGNGLFSGNLTAANITATGTLNVSGQTTLANASTTQITATGSTYLATTGGNVGINTTSPQDKLMLQAISGTNTTNGASGYLGILGGAAGANQTWGLYIATGTTPTVRNWGLFMTTDGAGAVRNNMILNANGYTAETFGSDGSVTMGGQLVFGNASGTQLTTTNSTYLATAGGNVGIGTTGPTEKLQVAGAIKSTSGLATASGGPFAALDYTTAGAGNGARLLSFGPDNSTPGTFNFYSATADNSSGGIRMFIGNTGNVGIGTTSPQAPLNVDSSTFPQLKLNSNSTSAGLYLLPTGSEQWDLLANGDNTFDIYDLTKSLYRFTLDSNGNVGIGTTSPTQMLSVGTPGGSGASAYFAGNVGIGTNALAGAARLAIDSPSNATYIQFTDAGSSAAIIGTDQTGNYIGNSLGAHTLVLRPTNSGNTSITDASGNNILFAKGNGSGGNVGIGTASPLFPLSVAGSTAIIGQGLSSGSMTLYLGQAASADQTGVVSYNRSTDVMSLLIGGDATPTGLNIIKGGNVGINTSAPNGPLNIKYASTNPTAQTYNGAFVIDSSDGRTSLQMGIGNTTWDGAWIQSYNEPATAANNYTLALNPLGGNVGIGTTTVTTHFENAMSSAGSAERISVAGLAHGITTIVPTDTAVNWNVGSSGNTVLDTFTSQYDAGSGLLIRTTGAAATAATNPYMEFRAGLKSGTTIGDADKTNQVLYQFETGTGSQLVSILNNGNIGIGTGSPGAPLTISVSAAHALASFNASGYDNTHIDVSNGQGSAGISMGVYNGDTNGAEGNITVSSGDLALITSGHNAYFSGGNVGIGTTTPKAILHLSGGQLMVDNPQIGNSTYAQSYDIVTRDAIAAGAPLNSVDRTTQRAVQIFNDGTNAVFSTTYFGSNPGAFGDVFKYNNASGVATEAMRIDGTGNVGIGQTAPTSKLEVSSAPTTGTYLGIQPAAANGTQVIHFGAHSGAAPDLAFTNDGNSEIMRLTNAGNVGIGTTTPGALLQVYKSGGQSSLMIGGANQASDYSTIEMRGNNTQNNWLISSSYLTGSALQFTPSTAAAGSTYSTPAMTILAGGNVGIGTTGPGAKLDIGGGTTWNNFSPTAIIHGGANETLLITPGSVLSGSTGMALIALNDADNGYEPIYLQGSLYNFAGGNVGLGTTTPGSLLSLGNTGANTINISNTATSTFGTGINLTTGCFAVGGNCITGGSSQWTTTGSDIYFTGGNVGIGTTTPNATLTVTGKTATFNSTADGSLGSWSTTSSLSPGVEYASSVTANGYVYELGGSDPADRGSNSFAKLNSDGTVGSWSTNAHDLPVPTRQGTAVSANGYVYFMGGANGSTAESTVYYAKLNSDGNTGSWSTANALPAGLYNLTSVVADGYIYVLGGHTASAVSAAVYYAKLNSDGSVGSWSTNSNALPTALQAGLSVVANGYVYYIGGNNDTIKESTVYYAKLNSDGSVGSWSTNSNALPAARDAATGFVANGYVYVMGGNNGSAAQTTVYYAKLNSDGSVGSWSTNSNALPAVRESATSVAANGYVYVIGGSNGTSIQTSVYYASTSRILISGDLDLLGLASTTLSGVNSGGPDGGSVGGSIYAGNIFSAGSLQATGDSTFWGGLSVSGSLNASATTTIYNGATVAGLNVLNGAICSDNNGGSKCTGTLTPGVVYGDSSSFTPSDVAENYPVSDTSIEAGDIVSIAANVPVAQAQERSKFLGNTDGKDKADNQSVAQILTTAVVKATPETKDAMIGAISTNPGVLLGDTTGIPLNTETRPVALTGRIPVKVNLEGGPISSGDPITISSTPGVGMKATTTGMIIGYALEDYTGPTAENQGKVLVFSSRMDWQAPATSLVSDSLAQVVTTMQDWFQGMGITITQNLINAKNVVVDTLTANTSTVINLQVGNADHPTGITLYDTATHDPYCVVVKNGTLQNLAGACDQINLSSTATTTTSTTSGVDTTPPVITITGSASLTINLGIVWADPGATVVDPADSTHVENDNLGIYYSVDGTQTGNGGRDLPTIDTSVAGTHTITYTSTDSAGNTGTATRTVTVVDPNAMTASTTTSSTTPSTTTTTTTTSTDTTTSGTSSTTSPDTTSGTSTTTTATTTSSTPTTTGTTSTTDTSTTTSTTSTTTGTTATTTSNTTPTTSTTTATTTPTGSTSTTSTATTTTATTTAQ